MHRHGGTEGDRAATDGPQTSSSTRHVNGQAAMFRFWRVKVFLDYLAEAVSSVARYLLLAVLMSIAAISDSAQLFAARCTLRLPSYLWNFKPIITAKRKGVILQLDLRDNVQRALYFTGWYERRYIKKLLALIRSGDICADIGAHVGVHSVALAKRLEFLGEHGEVLAFEPAPDTAQRLRDMVKRNALGNIRVVEYGLADWKGHGKLRGDSLRFNGADVGVRSLFGPDSTGQEVAVTTFDSWAKTECLSRLDIVKIDVEGAEMAVLSGMEESIRKFRPRAIGVEIRGYLLAQAGVSEPDLRKRLHDLGYVAATSKGLDGNVLFESSIMSKDVSRGQATGRQTPHRTSRCPGSLSLGLGVLRLKSKTGQAGECCSELVDPGQVRDLSRMCRRR
jgi:FkbM family methyltransferase